MSLQIATASFEMDMLDTTSNREAFAARAFRSFRQIDPDIAWLVSRDPGYVVASTIECLVVCTEYDCSSRDLRDDAASQQSDGRKLHVKDVGQ